MIYGERIRQARELRRFTQTELAEQLGTHQENLAAMESGRRAADVVADRLPWATGLPLGFFERPVADSFPLGSLLFRARKAVPKRDRAEVHRWGQLLLEIHDDLAVGLNLPSSTIPQGLQASPVQAAQLTRSALGLGPSTPINLLISVLEKHGVVVLGLPTAVPGCSGYSVWVDNRPVIAIAPDQPGDRLRWTIAHELGHLVVHRVLRGDPGNLDAEADAFAAEFMTPRDSMIEEFRLGVAFQDLCDLKLRWGVSIQSLARRAREVGALSESQYYGTFTRLARLGYSRTREPEAYDVAREKPRLLRQLAERRFGVPVRVDLLAQHVGLNSTIIEQVLDAHAAGRLAPGATGSRAQTPQAARRMTLPFRPKPTS